MKLKSNKHSNIGPTGIEAYKPSEIAMLVENAGVAKARLASIPMITLAVLAGAFIALGAVAYTLAMTGVDPSFGPARLLGGLAFSLGLILVVVGGAELFTGNALMVMAAVDRRISVWELCKSWCIVYLGNFIGAIVLVLLIFLSGILDGPMGETAARITEAKLNLSWSQAFFRGVLCNILVCLAIWLSLAAHTVSGKVLAIIWPVTCFVALGFEHSIANMYLIPQGLTIGVEFRIWDIAHSLFFVTLGNIVGGVGGVALTYKMAYGKAPNLENI